MSFRLRIQRELLNFVLELEQEGSVLLTESIPLTDATDELLSTHLGELQVALSPSPWVDPEPTRAAQAAANLARVLGQQLSERMREALSGGGTLILETADRTLPWELAELPGHGPLGQLWSLTRQLAPPPTDSPRSTGRGVLLADSQGLLPWSTAEAQQVARALKEVMPCQVLSGPESDQLALMGALNQGGTSLLHLWAYAGGQGLDATIHLSDRPVTRDDLRELVLGRLPELVVLSLYPGVGSSPRPLLEPLTSWAQLLTGLGARSVVGWLWDVAHAERFWVPFYQSLSQGVPVAQALLETRRRLQGQPDPWLASQAMVLFGDPETRLTASQAPAMISLATVESSFAPLYQLVCTGGPEQGRKIPLFPQALEEGQVITLGAPGLKPNEIELEDPELPNRAASLQLRENGLQLSSLPGADVKVNGLAVRQVFLFGGESIELGSTRLEFQRASAAPKQGEKAILEGRFFLRVTRGTPADLNKSFPLKQGVSVLGRLADCAIVLHDPTVSRQHAFFTLQDEVRVAPVGSATTVVNGVILERERELQPGDLLQLSENTVLKFLDARSQS
ncbi:MAG: hypothetical protein AMXMBFR33_58800 [Candidatus Xenobia bacterium]